MLNVPTYKKILSYLWPVRLRKSSGTENSVLELFLYRNQYQLATIDALYSDGKRYRPVRSACSHIHTELPQIKDVLVLGTGIASAVRIIESFDAHPQYTLIEYDKTVLQWALELLPEGLHSRVTPIHANAQDYMQENDKQYSLVITDIFESRLVPRFVMETEFFELCRRSIRPGGYWVLNYILQPDDNWEKIHRHIGGVFPDNDVIVDGVNRIVVAKV